MELGLSDLANAMLLVWVAIGVVFDLCRREIPDTISLAIVFSTPVAHYLAGAATLWWWHVGGGVLALILGAFVGGNDRLGGGDVKLFAALGVWFGLGGVIPLALWIALAGLPLSLLAAARGHRDLAYGPAIWLGLSVHVFAPRLLWTLGGVA